MIQLNWAWAFFLLPLPWVIRWLLPPARLAEQAALKVPFFDRLTTINTISSTYLLQKTLHWRRVFMYLGWFLLIFSLSDPQWVGDPIPLEQKGRSLMLAIDLSGSMAIEDMKIKGQAVDRLTSIRHVVETFIKQREGDRIGLVLFGTQAYLQTPLTFDLRTVQAMLDDASIALAGPQTAIGDALGLSVKHLLTAPAESRAIILLTDGGNNAGHVTPLEAADLAAKNNIKIYTIGFGSEQAVVRSFFGPQIVNPSADLDIQTLKEIAQRTGGKFFRAQNTDSLKGIYDAINQLEPINKKELFFRPLTPLFAYPLSAALMISLILSWRYWGIFLFRKRNT